MKATGRDITPDQVEAWVQRSCADQGVALRVIDSDVIGHVSALFGSRGKGRPSAPRSGRRQGAASSKSPRGLDSVRVETLCPSSAGPNRGVVEQRADDGYLPTQCELFPLGSERYPPVEPDEGFSVRGT